MWASVCPAEGTASSKALGRICRGLVIQSKLISEHVMGLDNNFFRSLLVSWPQPYISLPLAIPEGIPLNTYNSQTQIQPTPVIIPPQMSMLKSDKTRRTENQDGGVGRHTAPPRTTRTDRESNSKGDQHQGNRK